MKESLEFLSSHWRDMTLTQHPLQFLPEAF